MCMRLFFLKFMWWVLYCEHSRWCRSIVKNLSACKIMNGMIWIYCTAMMTTTTTTAFCAVMFLYHETCTASVIIYDSYDHIYTLSIWLFSILKKRKNNKKIKILFPILNGSVWLCVFACCSQIHKLFNFTLSLLLALFFVLLWINNHLLLSLLFYLSDSMGIMSNNNRSSSKKNVDDVKLEFIGYFSTHPTKKVKFHYVLCIVYSFWTPNWLSDKIENIKMFD